MAFACPQKRQHQRLLIAAHRGGALHSATSESFTRHVALYSCETANWPNRCSSSTSSPKSPAMQLLDKHPRVLLHAMLSLRLCGNVHVSVCFGSSSHGRLQGCWTPQGKLHESLVRHGSPSRMGKITGRLKVAEEGSITFSHPNAVGSQLRQWPNNGRQLQQ